MWTTSAFNAASSMVNTVKPSAFALSHDAPPFLSPTTTFKPLSDIFNACALP